MTRQRMAMYGGLLAAAVAVGATGLDAKGDEGAQPSDRRVIRFDGPGSQLGMMVSDVDDAAQPGARIDGVNDDSAAEKAGVKEGDVVVEFDGERVRSARQLTRLVQETPAGRAVKMTVLRGAARQTLEVTPEAGAMFSTRLGPEMRNGVERGTQGFRMLPPAGPPSFDFHVDGEPGMAVPAFPGLLGLPTMAGRGRLGVQVDELSDQLASYFGAPGGVLVSSVTKASPAEKAGLKAGDVITAVNGKPVRDAEDLVGELSDVKDGTAVSLAILRDKKASTVKATLTAPERSRARRPTRPA